MMKCDLSFIFRPLSKGDIPLIHRWFNMPHVQTFYSLRQWTEEEVLEKLKPILEKEQPIFGFIIYYSQKPIGYIQYYRLADYPWPNQDIDEEISQLAAGLDLFIGEVSFIQKGIGSKAILSFLEEEIWLHFSFCFVDPDLRNEASIRMFQKCGFQLHKNIHTVNALKQSVMLSLMKIARPN